MELSPRQVDLLRASFAQLEPKAKVAALAYYQRLFATHPELRAQLRADLDTETRRLMELLRAATEFADQPAMLQSYLSVPGRSCPGFDASAPHLPAAGDALLWSLDATLGGELSPETRVAWAALHSTVSALVRPRAG
jgi:hemoglobin-like flavoprotein